MYNLQMGLATFCLNTDRDQRGLVLISQLGDASICIHLLAAQVLGAQHW